MNIPYEERREVYLTAISHYGSDCQIWKAIEEMSELTKELCKLQNSGGSARANMVDEIADVTIMMEQLRILFNMNNDVQERIDYKVRRLACRIVAEGGRNNAEG